MKQGVVYLKLEQNNQVVNRRILIQDVGEIYTPDAELKKEIGGLTLYTVKGDKNQTLVFTSMKVIEMIQKQRPEISVESIGETDFIVEYKLPNKPKKGWEYAKTVLLMVIIFFGAAFTIMTFNEDVSVAGVFSMFYELVMGTKEVRGNILEISYCIGIAIGILGFYNHFSASKEQVDPTPLHVEMRNYEQEVNQAVIQDASRKGTVIK